MNKRDIIYIIIYVCRQFIKKIMAPMHTFEGQSHRCISQVVLGHQLLQNV